MRNRALRFFNSMGKKSIHCVKRSLIPVEAGMARHKHCTTTGTHILFIMSNNIHTDHTFRDQVVVITGASAGVGRATAWALARQGARVVLLARGMDGLEGARKEVEQYGGKALAISVDVADPEAVEAAAEQAERE